MVFAIGACEEKKSQVGSTSAPNDADKSATEKFVKIGKQVWMAKNLNDASKGGKCYDDKPENCEKYGRLYTWEEATKACPSGWHLPNNAEWEALVSSAGGMDAAGGKLKAKKGWNDYYGESGNGTDEYGFSALPGDFGRPGDRCYSVGYVGGWWSSNEAEYDADDVYIWSMGYSKVNKNYGDRSILLSVRCVKTWWQINNKSIAVPAFYCLAV